MFKLFKSINFAIAYFRLRAIKAREKTGLIEAGKMSSFDLYDLYKTDEEENEDRDSFEDGDFSDPVDGDDEGEEESDYQTEDVLV